MRIQCSEGKTSLIDGGCGSQNCAAGEIDSNGALIAHPQMNDGKSAGPYMCPDPFSGEAAVSCSKGQNHVSLVTLYDEDFDETFTLCRCCELMQSAPDPPMLEPEEQKVSLFMFAAGLLGGCICAAMTGYHFLGKEKLSKVLPEDKDKDQGTGSVSAMLSRNFSKFSGRSSSRKSTGSRKSIDSSAAKNDKKGDRKETSEGGIKGKLRTVLSVFVGVVLCGYLLTRIAECLRNACDSLKERRARKKASKDDKKPSSGSTELREAGEAGASEATPGAPDVDPEAPPQNKAGASEATVDPEAPPQGP